MKSHLLILFISIVISIKTSGQSSVVGNTFGGPANYLGWDATTGSPPLNIKTTNAKPINFLTKNIQRATIDTLGNVGIGTSTPNVKLHVADTNDTDGIRLGDNFRLREYSGNFGPGTLEIYHDQDMGLKRIVFFANDSGATMDGYFDDGRLRIGSAFNLPAARLESEDTLSAQLRLTNMYDSLYTDFFTTQLGDLFIDPHQDTLFRNVGIGTKTPGNKLEINSADLSAYPGNSGLRFTDLVANVSDVQPIQTISKPGVLSVDTLGNVILVYDPGLITLTADNGLSMNSSSNVQLGGSKLIQSTQIPMNGHNLVFLGQDADSDMVGIGITGTMIAKFNVDNRSHVMAGNFSTSLTAPHNVGIMASCANGTKSNTALFSNAFTSSDNTLNFGIKSYASTISINSENYGGFFYASSEDGHAKSLTGVYGIGIDNYSGSKFAYGGMFEAYYANYNYGIYASVADTVIASNCAGYFNGSVVTTGPVYSPSDAALKTNIHAVDNAMAIINQLNPKYYDYQTSQYNYMHLPSGTQCGLIAQEVAPLIPSAVKATVQPERLDTAGNIISPEFHYTSLNYSYFIPLLIAAVKEQKQQLESLQDQLDRCCNAFPPEEQRKQKSETEVNKAMEELSNDKASLIQNSPNPFKESTSIEFYLPESVSHAMIIVYDLQGKQLRKYENLNKGKSKIEILGGAFNPGMYIYTLIADGKQIAEKRMILTE